MTFFGLVALAILVIVGITLIPKEQKPLVEKPIDSVAVLPFPTTAELGDGRGYCLGQHARDALFGPGWFAYPAQTGVYMGIFKFFIVISEITASLMFGRVMAHR
jgi:hypothetical protein